MKHNLETNGNKRHVFQIGHMNHETTLSKIGTLWHSATGHCCDHAHLGTCNSCQYCWVQASSMMGETYQEHAESGEQLKQWRDNIPPFSRFMALSYFDCKCRYRCFPFFVLCSSGLLVFPRFLIIDAILVKKFVQRLRQLLARFGLCLLSCCCGTASLHLENLKLKGLGRNAQRALAKDQPPLLCFLPPLVLFEGWQIFLTENRR